MRVRDGERERREKYGEREREREREQEQKKENELATERFKSILLEFCILWVTADPFRAVQRQRQTAYRRFCG